MRTADLGTFDAPVLIFGGVYSNLEAFEALLGEAGGRGIPPGRMIHTGDVVAYAADPDPCARMLRELGCPAIAGNVEEQLAARAVDCGCGFDQGSSCDLLSVRWFSHADAQIGNGLRDWMAGLPTHLTFTLGGRRFVVAHGAPSSISRYVYADADDTTLAAELDLAEADAAIVGHTGFPMLREVGERLWLNAGAIGIAADDGTPRSWFAVLTPQADGVAVEILPLVYDHDRAIAKLRAAGLPEPYAVAMGGGPAANRATLPEPVRALCGRRRDIAALDWRHADAP